jgi:hypothetical protein
MVMVGIMVVIITLTMEVIILLTTVVDTTRFMATIIMLTTGEGKEPVQCHRGEVIKNLPEAVIQEETLQ